MWSRKLKSKHQDQWPTVFALLNLNEQEKIKVACIVWWDCYKAQEEYDWTFVKSKVKEYKFDESQMNHDNIASALCHIGYPKEIAQHRAIIKRGRL